MSANTTTTEEGRAFVKASAIAKFYDVTTATVYRWAQEGRIPTTKFQDTLRFDLEAVRAVIEGGAK
jgi:hypothetical protein